MLPGNLPQDKSGLFPDRIFGRDWPQYTGHRWGEGGIPPPPEIRTVNTGLET